MFTTRTRLRCIGGRRGVLVGLVLVVVLGVIGIGTLGGRGTVTDHETATVPEMARPGAAARDAGNRAVVQRPG